MNMPLFGRLSLLLTLALTTAGCFMNVNIGAPASESQVSSPGEEVTDLWVTGENDFVADKFLRSSDVATLTWNGSPAGHFLISILDSTGLNAVCSDLQAYGNVLELSACPLDDYTTYQVRITPASADYQGLLSPRRLFEIRTEKLRWNYSAVTVLPNETVQLAVHDGSPAYAFSASANFNSATLEYTAPISLPAADETLTVTDQHGTSVNLPIKRLGFSDSADANALAPGGASLTRPKEALLANDGSLVMTHYVETSRWQYDYVVLKSTDKGATSSYADSFIPSIWDPTMPRAITKTPAGVLFSCAGGYNDSHAFAVVRKSVDNGDTWTTAYLSDSDQDEACYDVTANSQGWVLYVGIDPDASNGENGVVKLSKDLGATWQTIYSDSGLFFEAEFAPDDSVWIFGATQTAHIIRFLKGTYNGSSWSFSQVNNPAGLNNTYYSTQWAVWDESGIFHFDDASHGYFIGANNFDLLETTDGGTTWTKAYTGPNGIGRGLLKTPDGTLFISGQIERGMVSGTMISDAVIYRKRPSDPAFVEAFRRTNPGTSSFTRVEYCGPLIRYPDGDLITLCFIGGWPQPSHTYISHDNGDTWVHHGTTAWWQHFTQNSRPSGIFQAKSGELLVSTSNADPSGASTAFIGKSTDGGASWSKLHDFRNTANAPDPSTTGDEINLVAKDDNGVYYALGTNWTESGYFSYASTDGGANWIRSSAPKDGASNYNAFAAFLPAQGANVYLFATSSSQRLDVYLTVDQGASFTKKSSIPFSGGTAFAYSASLYAQDGALWLAGNETDGGLNYHRVYRSTDGGGTWQLVHSEPATSAKVKIVQGAQGEIFISGANIYASTDQGATWLTTAVPAAVSDFVVLANGKVVLQSTAQIWTQSSLTGNWVKIEDLTNYELLDLGNSRQIFQLGPKSIGVAFYYTDTLTGFQVRLKKLDIP